MKRLFSLIIVLFLSALLVACPSGGGGSSSPTPPPIVVSGTVHAPGGQVAFYRQQDFLERFTDRFTLSAYAAVSGLSLVPDGTVVEIGRIDSSGNFTPLSTTTTSNGKYTFNLTNLGLGFSSDLVVRVFNTGTGVQMRGFVNGETVKLDPVSESAVRMVLEQLALPPGSSLGNFTPQELRDFVDALDLLTTTNHNLAGITIEDSVASIKHGATTDSGLMTFLVAASGPGETTEGPGDIGNYVPMAQGNIWRTQATKLKTGQQPMDYIDTYKINGTKIIGSISATVFAESNSNGLGQSAEDYLVKDSRGVSIYGNDDAGDTFTPQIMPYMTLRFPLHAGATFESVNKTGLSYGDLDSDGKNELADVLVQVKVVSFESVSVPAGTFDNSAKIETKITLTVTVSSTGTKLTVIGTQTDWYAPGVGQVKSQYQIDGQGISETENEVLIGYFIDGKGKGIVTPLTITTATTNEFFVGKSALATDGAKYLLVSCRELGSSPGIFGVFISGTTAGKPFLIASGDCSSLGGTSENSISQPSVVFDGTNYLVVFVKGAIIRGMRVSQSGEVLDGATGFPISTGILFSISSTSPALAFDGSNYLVVWKKYIPIDGIGTRNIYGATVTPAGQVSAEIPISIEQYTFLDLGFAFDIGAPAIAFDGSNYLVAWNKIRSGSGTSAYSSLFAVYNDISVSRITTQGTVLDSSGILFATSGPFSQSPSTENIKVAFDGTNYLTVWRKSLTIGFDPPSAEIRGARISPDGTLLDGPASAEGFGINTTVLGKSEPAVAFDGSNYLVAWVVGAYSNSPPAGMFGARVSPDGQIIEGLSTATGISLSDPPTYDRIISPVINSNGSNVLLTWRELTNTIPGTLIFP